MCKDHIENLIIWGYCIFCNKIAGFDPNEEQNSLNLMKERVQIRQRKPHTQL